IPVLPMRGPTGASRPGILTALAIVSIIVACLSAVASLGSGFESYVVYRTATFSRLARAKRTSRTLAPSVPKSGYGAPANTVNPPTPTAAGAGSQQDDAVNTDPDETPTDSNGLLASDRAVVTSVLTQLQPFSAPRRRQLNAFLARQGISAFPTGNVPLTDRGVRASISRSATDPGDDDVAGHAMFSTSWGTLKVYDDKAEFSPANGSAPTVVSASVDPAMPGPAGSASLTPAVIAAAVQRAQSATGNKLTAAQLAGLTAALRDPNQQLIAPGTEWSPVRAGFVNSDGSAWVYLSGGYVAIAGDGTVQSNAIAQPPLIKVNNTACGMVALDAIVSAGLAILLFVSALLLLAQSPRGRRLHRIFAVIKIPAAPFGGAMIAWMNYELVTTNAVRRGGNVSAAASIAIYWGIAIAVAGCLYPIALLIVLHTRTVRDYYNAVRG
ncbi:MAG TPA: hypothetical protein VFC78_16985, partial [Tepidisphaeraceae bacterium]|nr:hypothetical protein [Tepidisphaeraceae bacterium]